MSRAMEAWYRLKDNFPWNAIRIDDIRVYPRVVVGVTLVLTPLHDRAVAPIFSHSIRVSFYNVVPRPLTAVLDFSHLKLLCVQYSTLPCGINI